MLYNGAKPPDSISKIVCFSAPGGHMSWVAASVGYIYGRWDLESQINPENGSAHFVKDLLPHFSRSEREFTIKNYETYLEENAGFNGWPTIYHDGFGTVQEAKLWPVLLGYMAKRDDIMFIPCMASNMQEANYVLLNAATKGAIGNTTADELHFLEKLTGVYDDGSLTMEELYEIMSKHLAGPLALLSGVINYSKTTALSMWDVSNTILPPFYAWDIPPHIRNSLKDAQTKYGKLQLGNWSLSEYLDARHLNTDALISSRMWHNPDSPVMKTLVRWRIRRNLGRAIPVDFDWDRPISQFMLPFARRVKTDFHSLEPDFSTIKYT